MNTKSYNFTSTTAYPLRKSSSSGQLAGDEFSIEPWFMCGDESSGNNELNAIINEPSSEELGAFEEVLNDAQKGI